MNGGFLEVWKREEEGSARREQRHGGWALHGWCLEPVDETDDSTVINLSQRLDLRPAQQRPHGHE